MGSSARSARATSSGSAPRSRRPSTTRTPSSSGPGRGVQLERAAAHAQPAALPHPHAQPGPRQVPAAGPGPDVDAVRAGGQPRAGQRRPGRPGRAAAARRRRPAPGRGRRGRRARGRGRARPPRGPTVSPGRGDHCTVQPPRAPRTLPHPERDRPLRREPLARSHRRACSRRSGRVNGARHPCRPGRPRPDPSRHIHSWVHSWGQTHTGVVTGVGSRHTRPIGGTEPQVRAVRVRSVSPHSVDNPGGGAPCRPVDEALGLCTASYPGHDEGPRPRKGRGPAGRRGRCQRQRIDMTRPATMAPKPMAKFHAPSDTMNGMRSPAT